jgi:hypothetical protein
VEGKPIKFDGRPFGYPGDIGIMFGETEEAIVAELQVGVVASNDEGMPR